MNAEALSRLRQADALRDSGQVLQAELVYLDVLKRWPGARPALVALAGLALQRGDAPRATRFLATALAHHPDDRPVLLDLALLYLRAGDAAQARTTLEHATRDAPDFYEGWLLLGRALDALGESRAALKAYLHAIVEARHHGRWLDERTTPPPLLSAVLRATQQLREQRRELLRASYDTLRDAHGDDALARVDRALGGYLREWDATPADPRQRPRFFFFPGLPNTPFHDPGLQPWAGRLRAAFHDIRAEALQVLQEDAGRLPDFIDDRRQEYVSGDGAAAWKAFFFYRHGRRHDAHHARCPRTSAVLESLDLCRLEDQAPEVLFSVLAPGSHINPHHGVSNVRLVMHLPLIVPQGCALHLVGHCEHAWREGELVMFDDTYLHEAWNRSPQTRVVLLMDCWNPHLTGVERLAVKQLLETISALHRADRLQPAWHDD
ncbi:aspartyl/asparaginyl beta-hydroxylase domain-containing protein [Rhizobacter sp. J219]|uniref:aspartyl/asparaginyl beta-hydroxylase domain-containing protein n=1 Tax=Rhizobacter sp. J219 TaxID=2898430 RepID=UPI0021514D17|nr:aspartyl/asparaginyl beta-hydroxylase domain-containing protein [Rhizobacter sp. J219]MCR5882561.1 aspartyl/asparaginyl beta-hydroxylase domain-containing protein [Rhizobacter sp. J219]